MVQKQLKYMELRTDTCNETNNRRAMSIEVKNTVILRNLLSHNYHPKLISLACWIIDTGGMIYFTSGYRHADKGVHGTNPCRGMDIRSWIYVSPRALCVRINGVWKYDPDRRPDKRCALVHDKGSGVHIHLQVHKNTEYIGQDD